MQAQTNNTQRIAVNTLALYFRTMITLLVSLYTGRVLLHVLGVEDYGIYDVVAGIVAMSGVITSSMSQSISRFITYSLGSNKSGELKKVFSTSLFAQLCISVIVCVILEVIGLWFLSSKAMIPEGRHAAAQIVLHFSILSLAVSLVSTPYNALIIAHERMTVFAYTSVIEVSLRLAMCLLLQISEGDRLIIYGLLQVLLSIIMRIIYGWYCCVHFEDAKFQRVYIDKQLLKKLYSFSGWNLLSSSAWVFNTHGVNMLINVCFGVVYNASRGIASMVNSAIQSFVSNFTTAFTPQITKSYASGNVEAAVSLTNRGTKYTWILILFFLVPVFMEAEMILDLWLEKYPPYAPLFLRLAMLESLSVQSGILLYKLIQANGDIKRYNIEILCFVALVFPIVGISYKCGGPVWISYVVFIVIYFLVNIVRFRRLKALINFSMSEHIQIVWKPCAIVSFSSFVIPVLIHRLLGYGILRFIIVVPISIISVAVCSYCFALSSYERRFIINKVRLVFLNLYKRI